MYQSDTYNQSDKYTNKSKDNKRIENFKTKNESTVFCFTSHPESISIEATIFCH